MKAQTPAEGILKTNDWGDSRVYKVVCECGQSDHEHNVWVESDSGSVNVNIYTTVKTNASDESIKPNYNIDSIWLQEFDLFWKSLYNGLVRRVKLTKSIWIKGYVDYETTISMTEQQAFNYAETLKSAVKDVAQFRKEKSEKSTIVRIAEQGDCV